MQPTKTFIPMDVSSTCAQEFQKKQQEKFAEKKEKKDMADNRYPRSTLFSVYSQFELMVGFDKCDPLKVLGSF